MPDQLLSASRMHDGTILMQFRRSTGDVVDLFLAPSTAGVLADNDRAAIMVILQSLRDSLESLIAIMEALTAASS